MNMHDMYERFETLASIVNHCLDALYNFDPITAYHIHIDHKVTQALHPSESEVVHAVILLALVDAGVVLYIDVGHRSVRFSKALLNEAW
jgi:hypothetical protein